MEAQYKPGLLILRSSAPSSRGLSVLTTALSGPQGSVTVYVTCNLDRQVQISQGTPRLKSFGKAGLQMGLGSVLPAKTASGAHVVSISGPAFLEVIIQRCELLCFPARYFRVLKPDPVSHM